MTVPDSATLERMLDRFIETVEPHRQETASIERALLEALFLRQELRAGRLKLPFEKVGDMFLTYATGEGWLNRIEGAHEQALALVEACTREPDLGA